MEVSKIFGEACSVLEEIVEQAHRVSLFVSCVQAGNDLSDDLLEQLGEQFPRTVERNLLRGRYQLEGDKPIPPTPPIPPIPPTPPSEQEPAQQIVRWIAAGKDRDAGADRFLGDINKKIHYAPIIFSAATHLPLFTAAHVSIFISIDACTRRQTDDTPEMPSCDGDVQTIIREVCSDCDKAVNLGYLARVEWDGCEGAYYTLTSFGAQCIGKKKVLDWWKGKGLPPLGLPPVVPLSSDCTVAQAQRLSRRADAVDAIMAMLRETDADMAVALRKLRMKDGRHLCPIALGGEESLLCLLACEDSDAEWAQEHRPEGVLLCAVPSEDTLHAWRTLMFEGIPVWVLQEKSAVRLDDVTTDEPPPPSEQASLESDDQAKAAQTHKNVKEEGGETDPSDPSDPPKQEGPKDVPWSDSPVSQPESPYTDLPEGSIADRARYLSSCGTPTQDVPGMLALLDAMQDDFRGEPADRAADASAVRSVYEEFCEEPGEDATLSMSLVEEKIDRCWREATRGKTTNNMPLEHHARAKVRDNMDLRLRLMGQWLAAVESTAAASQIDTKRLTGCMGR